MIQRRFIQVLACVLLALCFAAASSFAQENDAWTKANQEYAAGHFREAADLYQGLVQSGQTSAAIFYNIGNARFRMGEFGQAILNYERALALDQQHPEAAANLRLARDKARALELKRNPLESWAAYATTTQYTIALAVAAWIAVFAIAGMIFSQRRSGLRAAVLVLAVLVAAAAAAGLYARETGASGRELAIVTAKGTDARLATADNAGTVLTLPPGSEIKILSTRGDWIYAALPNDLRGWIPAKNAERVRL
jgi:tetratricopeptide (TPR) repeat protein